MAKQTYKVGDRVILKENKREGWPEERGEVVNGPDHGAWIVRVDPEFQGPDDTLRARLPSQLKPANT